MHLYLLSSVAYFFPVRLLSLVCSCFLRQPKEILIDSDKLTLHGLSQYYINLEENQKTRKLTDLMDILGRDNF